MSNQSIDSQFPQLDALRAEWNVRDQYLDKVMQDTIWKVSSLRSEKAKEDIRRSVNVERGVEVFAGIFAILFLGAFNFEHWLQWEFFVPGAALQMWVTVMFMFGVKQRVALQGLDFGLPVAILQGQIEQLAMARMRIFKWAFLTGQIVWYIPFLLVVFKGVFGVDLFMLSPFMPTFIEINLIGGVLAIPVLLWLGAVVKRSQARWPAMRRAIDSLTGRDIAMARAFVESLDGHPIY